MHCYSKCVSMRMSFESVIKLHQAIYRWIKYKRAILRVNDTQDSPIGFKLVSTSIHIALTGVHVLFVSARCFLHDLVACRTCVVQAFLCWPQIGSDMPQMGPNLVIFKISFSAVWIGDFVLFGVNLPQFVAKLTPLALCIILMSYINVCH